MPLIVKNGCLFIATKVKGVTNNCTPFSFEGLIIEPAYNYDSDRRTNIQNLLSDLKMNPSIENKIFVNDLDHVYLKCGNDMYHIGTIENKSYHGYDYDYILNNFPYGVVSYTVTGKSRTPNLGINLEIRIYGNTNDIIQHIMAKTAQKV
jgi:hypothetical protein